MPLNKETECDLVSLIPFPTLITVRLSLLPNNLQEVEINNWAL